MSRTDLYEFGKALLDTRDLDPVYVILHGAEFDRRKLHHWLLAYWCFYHSGTASWIVDQPDYWEAMEMAARSKEWPRSAERRHFRAQNAIKSVAWLKARGVDALFQPFGRSEVSLPVKEVMKYVQTWEGFGPWIAFKVADMLERLGICNVQFDTAAMLLFDSPREGAEIAWETYGKGDPPRSKPEWAIDSILSHLGDSLAPPRYERRINSQEAETILCKWKSHLGGRYELGDDIAHLRKGLLRFSRCKTSQKLLQAGRVKLW